MTDLGPRGIAAMLAPSGTAASGASGSAALAPAIDAASEVGAARGAIRGVEADARAPTVGTQRRDFAAEMRAEHEELLRRLRCGDSAAAVSCLRGQIRASRDRILRALIDNRLDIPLE